MILKQIQEDIQGICYIINIHIKAVTLHKMTCQLDLFLSLLVTPIKYANGEINAPVPPHDQGSRLRVLGDLFPQNESQTVCLNLFGSVVVGSKSNTFDICHDCNRSTFAPTHKYSSLRLPETSSDQNLHNLRLSKTSWDS